MSQSVGKDSFLLHKNHREIFDEMSDEEAGKLIKAVFEYEDTGQEPKLTGSLKFAFIPIRQWLDERRAKYEDICKKRAAAGAQGGRPTKQKQNEESKKSKRLSGKAKKPDYDSDSDYDSDIDEEDDLCARTHETFSSSFGRDPTPEETAHIIRTGKVFGLQELVVHAVIRAASYGAKTPTSYVDTILEEWRSEFITTEEELNDYLSLCDCRDGKLNIMSRDEAMKKLKQSKAERQLRHKGVG